MNLSRGLRIAVVTVCAAMPFANSAHAAPLLGTGALTRSTDHVINVRWRGDHWHPGWRHHGWRHGYGWGPAVGGVLAGAAIASAIANSRAQASENEAYCSQRFKSYDPISGTYLSYDGMRHPCP